MDDTPDEREQDKCPKCDHANDEYWPWCSPTGPHWGTCLQCGAPSFPREAFDRLIPRLRAKVARTLLEAAELARYRATQYGPGAAVAVELEDFAEELTTMAHADGVGTKERAT